MFKKYYNFLNFRNNKNRSVSRRTHENTKKKTCFYIAMKIFKRTKKIILTGKAGVFADKV